jgi:hypothetical protein
MKEGRNKLFGFAGWPLTRKAQGDELEIGTIHPHAKSLFLSSFLQQLSLAKPGIAYLSLLLVKYCTR